MRVVFHSFIVVQWTIISNKIKKLHQLQNAWLSFRWPCRRWKKWFVVSYLSVAHKVYYHIPGFYDFVAFWSAVFHSIKLFKLTLTINPKVFISGIIIHLWKILGYKVITWIYKGKLNWNKNISKNRTSLSNCFPFDKSISISTLTIVRKLSLRIYCI